MPTYNKDMSRVFVFSPLIRNQTMTPYRKYLDHMEVEDIHFHAYVDTVRLVLWMTFSSTLDGWLVVHVKHTLICLSASCAILATCSLFPKTLQSLLVPLCT